MAAPVGNQFWKLRSRHGREKLFKNPSLLWKEACKYFEWCEQNPIIEKDFRGKDATEVQLPKVRAFTLHGLCLFLGVNTKYFNDFKDGLIGKTDDLSKDFSEIVTRIEESCYYQKFTFSAAGFLNPSIIAKDLGLIDKKQIENNQKLDPDEREEIIKQLLDKATKK